MPAPYILRKPDESVYDTMKRWAAHCGKYVKYDRGKRYSNDNPNAPEPVTAKLLKVDWKRVTGPWFLIETMDVDGKLWQVWVWDDEIEMIPVDTFAGTDK